MGFGCLMVLNICFTYLWVLWGFGLYLSLGNSHVLVAMFDLAYHPGILGLFFYKQIRELVFGARMGVKGVDIRNLSSSVFG